MKRILLLRPDRAGDAIKTLPALRALCAEPGWEVEIVVSEHNASLFTFEPGVRSHTLPSRWKEFAEKDLRYWLESNLQKTYDVAVALPCDATDALERLVNAAPADRKIRPWVQMPAAQIGRDERENVAETIALATGIRRTIAAAAAWPILSAMDRAEPFKVIGEKRGAWIMMCPYASEAHRSFSPRLTLSLFRSLTQNPSVERVLFPGLSSDYERMEKLAKEVGSPKLKTLFPSSFRSIAAFLERCDGFVGADSGPLHLAVALGVPSLGFMARSDRARWYPQIKDVEGASRFVHGGLFGRYPTPLTASLKLRKWLKGLPQSSPAPVLAKGMPYVLNTCYS